MEYKYLDANVVFDLALNRSDVVLDFENNYYFISPLTVHILTYTNKISMHDVELISILNNFTLVEFSSKITNLSLSGPTSDFEDNVQLNSALEAGCEYFITNDKKLLDMKSYGGMLILAKV